MIGRSPAHCQMANGMIIMYITSNAYLDHDEVVMGQGLPSIRDKLGH